MSELRKSVQISKPQHIPYKATRIVMLKYEIVMSFLCPEFSYGFPFPSESKVKIHTMSKRALHLLVPMTSLLFSPITVNIHCCFFKYTGFLVVLEHNRIATTSGLWFPLSSTKNIVSQDSHLVGSSLFQSLFKCHFLREAYPTYLINFNLTDI